MEDLPLVKSLRLALTLWNMVYSGITSQGGVSYGYHLSHGRML
jgi:hypothetical protein